MSDNGALNGEAAGAAARARWPVTLRVAFRFLFVYLILYIFPSPLTHIPWLGFRLGGWWNEAKQEAVVWVGRTVFGLEITVFPGGSGDTTYNYVELFAFWVVALAGAAIWSAIDFRRRAYPLLHDALRVYVRYTLGLTMIGYGMAKVIKTQFPFPDAYRLTETFGEASPMGLLWAFMGYSTGYNVFAGLGEVVPGVLLFYRRTTLLGALLGAGVMANIVALNYFYDVPVKLFSSHLLFQCLFLIAPDVPRLARFLVLHRPVGPGARLRAFPWAWANWTWFGVKSGLLGLVLVMGLVGQSQMHRSWGDGAPKPPLFGLYEVEEFTVGGEARPPLATDADRWREVIVSRVSPWDQKGTMRTRSMTGESTWFRYQRDDEAKTLALTPTSRGTGRMPGGHPWSQSEEGPETWSIAFAEPEEGVVVLEGDAGGQTLSIRLRRKDTSEFLLMNRGFRWVNEFPFNR